MNLRGGGGGGGGSPGSSLPCLKLTDCKNAKLFDHQFMIKI